MEIEIVGLAVGFFDALPLPLKIHLAKNKTMPFSPMTGEHPDFLIFTEVPVLFHKGVIFHKVP